MSAHHALRTWIDGGDLDRSSTEALFGQLMDGEISEVMKSALLVSLAMKGPAVSEVTGAAAAMRRRVIAIPHTVDDVVDTCGTGGDGKGTFNVSTAAALVAAACGVPIAKHGNRSVSSRSGSADVLAALGVAIDLDPGQAARSLHDIGIAFLFAPRLHPAMKEVMPVRRELAVRTVFNVLGPLTNPAAAKRQVVGVYAPELVPLVAHVLAELGSVHALVVHGDDGLDEITVTGSTLVAEVRHGEVEVYQLDPEALGVELAAEEALLGGSPEDNAAAMRRVLGGERGPLAEITAINAGAAVYVAGLADDLRSGVERVRSALDDGLAAAKLDQLAAYQPQA